MIIFCGIDGTGKSTMASMITKYFNSRGVRTRRAWMRAHHTLAYLIGQIMVRMGYYRAVQAPDGRVWKLFDVEMVPDMKRLIAFLEFISVIPLILYRVWLPRLMGYTVIAERYVIDTVVYVSCWLSNGCFYNYGRILLNMIPSDSVIILLEVDLGLVSRRKPFDPLETQFLERQKKLYRKLAASLHANMIDTTHNSVDENFSTVLRCIQTNRPLRVTRSLMHQA